MININQLDWKKVNDLMPVIIQDASNFQVLMLGYMNQEALQQTIETQLVTFYSRTKKRLWIKGETSGNKLILEKIIPDCDNDTLLILVKPTGPVCHRNTPTCFDVTPAASNVIPAKEGGQKFDEPDWQFIEELEKLLAQRNQQRPEKSYTTSLFNAGLEKIAQKVGEEGVEVVIAALKENDQTLCEESADLLFHLLVLLQSRNLSLSQVIQALKKRS